MPPIRPDAPLRMYDPRTDMNYQFSCLDEAIDFLLWSWEYWQHRPWNRHRRSSYDPRYEPATCPPPDRRITTEEAMANLRIKGNFHDVVWMDEAVRIFEPDSDPEVKVKAAPDPSSDDDTPF